MIIKGILIVLTFVFAISGLCELIHSIRLLFLSSLKKKAVYSVVVLKPKEALNQVNFAAEQLNWLGDDYAQKVIAVTDSVTEAELDECRLAAEGKNILFCKLQELSEKITEQEK